MAACEVCGKKSGFEVCVDCHKAREEKRMGDESRPAIMSRVRELEARVKELETLVRVLIDNDPDDSAADGVTVLMVWRKEAEAALRGEGGKQR
jgi:hypothetical protein